MSYAIHVLVAEKFSEESYRRFLNRSQNLFGNWNVAQSTSISDSSWQIHQCLLESHDLPHDESVRVWVEATRRSGQTPMENFDYEWQLSFETSTGRTAIGLAVQLASVILAIDSFRFTLFVDRDCDVDHGVTEFRTKETIIEHLRRVLDIEFPDLRALLQRRGIVDADGYLVMPPQP